MKKYIQCESMFGEPEGFFTREDEIEYIEDPLRTAIKNKYGIDSDLRCYIDEKNNLEVDVNTADGYEFTIKMPRRIDMRKIRKPQDIQYCVPDLLDQFEKLYDGNIYANFYYILMNKLDEWALSGHFPGKNQKLELDGLLAKSDSTIEDIADANNCGECHTWEDLISALHIQFENGEREAIQASRDISIDWRAMYQEASGHDEKLYVLNALEDKVKSGDFSSEESECLRDLRWKFRSSYGPYYP